MDTPLRDRVGLLCEQLSRWPTLHATIRDAGAHTELDELLTILAAPKEPDRDRVLTLIDAIDQACTKVGLAGLTSRTKALSAGLTLPGGLEGDPSLAGWTCPLHRCERVVISQEVDGTPTCAARQNTPMTPYVLPLR